MTRWRMGGWGLLLAFGCTPQFEGDGLTAPAETTNPELVTSALGDPLPGLDVALLGRFAAGQEAFEEVEDVDDGLGPVFNGEGCAICHAGPAVGGSGAQIETRFGTSRNGVFDPLASLGGSLRQNFSIQPFRGCRISGEVVPPAATIVAGRRTTPLFGLGLVDAVPAADLQQLARAQEAGIRGIANLVMDPNTRRQEVGRFGWKAQIASLQTFAGDAYLNEMGITNPAFPNENCPQGNCTLLGPCDRVPELEDDGEDVDAFRDFMTLLAPPQPGKLSGNAIAGEQAFRRIGCVGCHVPTLRTGPNPIAALNRVEFHPYSDFLVHDMGALGDGITQGLATGRLMRTAPLWGVSAQPAFLHDGRATSLEAAVLAHDGQARLARDRYAALNAQTRSQLIAFLKSL